MPLLVQIPRYLLVAVLLLLVSGCDTLEGDKILSGSDPDTGARVEVRSQVYGGKMRVHMQVTRNDKWRRLVMADGVQLNHASLVRFNNWFLVLAGQYVLGGYDIANDKLVPVNSDALPFTVRNISGYVVDEKQLGDGDDVPPMNFRERTDPRS